MLLLLRVAAVSKVAVRKHSLSSGQAAFSAASDAFNGCFSGGDGQRNPSTFETTNLGETFLNLPLEKTLEEIKPKTLSSCFSSSKNFFWPQSQHQIWSQQKSQIWSQQKSYFNIWSQRRCFSSSSNEEDDGKRYGKSSQSIKKRRDSDMGTVETVAENGEINININIHINSIAGKDVKVRTNVRLNGEPLDQYPEIRSKTSKTAFDSGLKVNKDPVTSEEREERLKDEDESRLRSHSNSEDEVLTKDDDFVSSSRTDDDRITLEDEEEEKAPKQQHSRKTTKEPKGKSRTRKNQSKSNLEEESENFENEDKTKNEGKNHLLELDRLKSLPVMQINREEARRSYLELAKLPSVSKVLSATQSPEMKQILEKWKAKMVSRFGEDGFAQWQKNTFKRGEILHSNVEKYLLHGTTFEERLDEIREMDLPEPEKRSKIDQYEANLLYSDFYVEEQHLKSLGAVMSRFSTPLALESHVAHTGLGYQGYLDCACVIDGKALALVDWKTSGRRKYSLGDTYDNPLQVAAYWGAIQADERYDLEISEGAIVVTYNDGSPANVFRLDNSTLKRYWEQWMERIEEYNLNHK